MYPVAIITFEDGIIWRNAEQTQSNITLSFGLPALFNPGSGKLWFYSVFWADGPFSLKDARYSIVGNRQGSLAVTIQGSFSQAQFLTAGGMLTWGQTGIVDKNRTYPFSPALQDDLKLYLLPGNHIPSDDPEIKNLAGTLVRADSRADMYQTAGNIVYSPFIQNLAPAAEQDEAAAGEGVAQSYPAPDVLQSIKDKKAGRHTRARLICSLARAAGIPARVVMAAGGSVFSQFFIAGLGWIPVETAYPVYDYVRPLRTYLAAGSAPEERAVISVSGTDDENARVGWNPRIKAAYKNADTSSLKDYRLLATAKILFIKAAADERVPDEAKLQIGDTIYVMAVEAEGETLLVFQDKAGKELKKVTLSFDGVSCTVTIGEQLMWRFIPRKIGQILALENLECRTAPGRSPALLPAPSKQ